MNDNTSPAWPKKYEEWTCPHCDGTGECGPSARHSGYRCDACKGKGVIYVETNEDDGDILPATDY